MSLKFLNKKGWHTQSMANQARLFEARAKETARKKAEEEREAELRQEIERDQQRNLLRKLGSDPASMREKGGALSFMYEAPPGLTSSADNVNEETSTDGKKEKPASQMTVGEKFPGLRNAPVQNMGSVADAEAKGMAFVNPAAIKPLAIQVRNVRCLKCKQWGHSMGDPECSMRAHTVEEETFRKHIEDPLLLYDASSGSKVTERLVLRHAIDGTHGGQVSADCNEILLSDDDDVGAGKDGAGSLSKVERKAAKRRLKELKKQMKKDGKKKKKSKDRKRKSSSSSSSSADEARLLAHPLIPDKADRGRDRDRAKDRDRGRDRDRDRGERERDRRRSRSRSRSRSRDRSSKGAR